MIYLHQNSDEEIVIPKFFIPVSNEYVLTMTNGLDKTVHTFDNLTNVSEFYNYYKFIVDIDTTFTTGEYDSILKAGDQTLWIGIITVGEYKSTSTQYNTNTQGIQYNG